MNNLNKFLLSLLLILTPIWVYTSRPAQPVLATQERYEFPTCPQPQDGDHAHYDEGLHQIAGGDLVPGKDDVYSLGDGYYLQCYCGADGNGIQTNWTPTHKNFPNAEWGPEWNLDENWYYYENSTFSCEPEPTPTPTPTITIQIEEPQEAGQSASHDPWECAAPAPEKPANISVETGTPNDGCIEVYYWPAKHAVKHRIDYGPYDDGFIYATITNDITGHESICLLDNGTNYQAKVTGINQCGQEGEWSDIGDPRP